MPTGLTATLERRHAQHRRHANRGGDLFRPAPSPSRMRAAITGSASSSPSIPTRPSAAGAARWTVKEAGFSGAMPINGGTGPFTITASTIPCRPAWPLTLTGSQHHLHRHADGVGIFPAAPSPSRMPPAPARPRPQHRHRQGADPRHFDGQAMDLNQSGFTGVPSRSAPAPPFQLTSSTKLPPGLTPVTSGNSITFTGAPPSRRLHRRHHDRGHRRRPIVENIGSRKTIRAEPLVDARDERSHEIVGDEHRDHHVVARGGASTGSTRDGTRNSASQSTNTA